MKHKALKFSLLIAVCLLTISWFIPPAQAAYINWLEKVIDGTEPVNSVAEILVVGGRFNDPTVGTGTDFIFNPGTRISASAMSESGSNDVDIWLEIQEI